MKHIVLVGIAAALLSACSSGKGGSSGPVVAQQDPARPIVTGTAPAPATGKNISGHIMSVGNNKRATAITTSTPSDNVNVVVVGGKSISFIPTGYNVGNISISASNTARIGSGNSLKHSRYGYMHDGANSTPQIFAQGSATPVNQVPNQGVATYKGEAVHHKFTTGMPLPTIETPSATLHVNFGNKTFNGHIGPEQIKVAELSGKISGNVLSGTSAKGVTTNAQFYGPNAAEIAGVYRDADGSNSGAFGVKKSN